MISEKSTIKQCYKLDRKHLKANTSKETYSTIKQRTTTHWEVMHAIVTPGTGSENNNIFIDDMFENKET